MRAELLLQKDAHSPCQAIALNRMVRWFGNSIFERSEASVFLIQMAFFFLSCYLLSNVFLAPHLVTNKHTHTNTLSFDFLSSRPILWFPFFQSENSFLGSKLACEHMWNTLWDFQKYMRGFSWDTLCELVSDNMLKISEYKLPNSFPRLLTVTSGPHQVRVPLPELHCLEVSFSSCKSYGTFYLALSSLETWLNSHHDNIFSVSKPHWNK